MKTKSTLNKILDYRKKWIYDTDRKQRDRLPKFNKVEIRWYNKSKMTTENTIRK